MFGTIFQITYFKLWKKNNCVLGMCMCFFFFLKANKYNKNIIILFEERGSSLMWSNQVRPTIFNIFTKVSLSIVIWKLKTGRKSYLNLVFKHPNMRNVTQTLLNEIPYQTCFFFFGPQFLVFKHWKLLFGLPYQTGPRALTLMCKLS